MPPAKPSQAELRVLKVLWGQGPSTVRQIQLGFAEEERPAYTTVRTLVRRLEAKKALKRVEKAGSPNVFEPVMTRDRAQHSFIEEFLRLFRGHMQPAMNQLIEAGQLTSADIAKAEEALRALKKKKP